MTTTYRDLVEALGAEGDHDILQGLALAIDDRIAADTACFRWITGRDPSVAELLEFRNSANCRFT